MTKMIWAPLAAAVVLSGCSDFDGRTNDADNAVQDALLTPATPTSSLPKGQASYEGAAVFAPTGVILDEFGTVTAGSFDESSAILGGIADEAILVSDAEMTADFDNRTLSGELTDFLDSDGNEFSGSVDILNPTAGGGANITDAGGNNLVNVNLEGTIEDNDGVETRISGVGIGDFGGDEAENVIIATGAVASGGLNDSLTGFIVGERD